jgi:hypothetical protein
MDGSIRLTAAARHAITSRQQLAEALGAAVKFIADVAASPAAYYTEFTIPKANGEPRLIRPPRRSLRTVQRSLLSLLYDRVSVRSCLHGGLPGRSTVTHAVAHVGQHLVATLDLRKFFPSTTPGHLAPMLASLGFAGEVAEDLLQLVTLDGGLPQGAPTSSLLANLAFSAGDSRFIDLCRRRRLRYSRYVDDIAISGECDFHDLRGPFIAAIRLAGYGVADEKVRFMPNGTRQVVTGLVVNDRLRPTQRFVAELRHDIRMCLDLGASCVAAVSGETVGTLKSRLTGRVAHVQHIDAHLGRELRGRLCGVNWRSARQSI